MSFEPLTFDEAWKQAGRHKNRHLLLGNGFSIACEPSIFSYSSLFEKAKKSMSPTLIRVFDAMNTQDFEEVIRVLQRSGQIVVLYDSELGSIKKRMVFDACNLKEELIRAVANQHPARPSDIDDAKYQACRTFLAHFIGGDSKEKKGKIYTLNYDLLLYWALLHEDEWEDGTAGPVLKPDDGFRKDRADPEADYVIWHGETSAHKQNIHYLHGALHLFDAGHELKKFTWIGTGEPLTEQVKKALEEDRFPLFVAEGDSEGKIAKIRHNAYLHHSFKSFASMCAAEGQTALFVFGHSFSDNDRHVLDRIGRSKLAHVYVSLFGDPNSESNSAIRGAVGKIASLRKSSETKLKIDFFEAESAKVWG